MGDQGFDISFQKQLSVQSWTLYGIGIAIILLRTYARWQRARSASLLAPDDWLMMTAVPIFYTTLVVCLNIIATGGGSNLFPLESFSTFSQDEIEDRIKGSKIVVVSEQAMLNVIWTLKICMLFMYMRMTTGTTHIRWIKAIAIYVAIGWVAVEITFFTACRPFNGYWGVPPPNPQCTTLERYAIVQAVFNISSDCMIIALPLPMIASLSLPLKQRCILGVVFSMGIFVIIAAILTKIHNLSDVYDTAYMLWYTREASVAVYVANLPSIWPLLREHIRFLRNHTSYPHGSATLPQYGNVSRSISKVRRSRIQATPRGHNSDEIELGRQSPVSKSTSQSQYSVERAAGNVVAGPGSSLHDFPLRTGGRALGKGDEEKALSKGNADFNFEVHVDRTIEVRRVSWDGRSAGGLNERYEWEVERRGPEVHIEGPEGEVLRK